MALLKIVRPHGATKHALQCAPCTSARRAPNRLAPGPAALLPLIMLNLIRWALAFALALLGRRPVSGAWAFSIWQLTPGCAHLALV